MRAALARVVPDETRHAQLAWRFVKWALCEGPRGLRSATAREVVAIVEGAIIGVDDVRQIDGVTSDVLREHGMLSEGEGTEIHMRVLTEVVLPCARALVASTRPRDECDVSHLAG